MTWRHLAVVIVPLVMGVLAWFNVVGAGTHAERFDAKQITVSPAGTDGLHIREVVDEDFGTKDRHGYERIIPTDFGRPTDVTASSPDAPAGVSQTAVAGGSQIRVGDPDTTVSGQHRYVLDYTLPDARLSTGSLALDIVGAGTDNETRRLEVIVTGLDLDQLRCNVGRQGTSGGCNLEPFAGGYRAVLQPLAANDGLTIGATITGRRAVVEPAVPLIPARRSDTSPALGLAVAAISLLGGAGVFAGLRRRGSNDVVAGGPADAAFGPPTVPAPDGWPAAAGAASPNVSAAAAVGVPTTRVPDSRMAALATTEFVPPPRIGPWQGLVLLRERVDDDVVAAWFSGLIADETLQLDGEQLSRSPQREPKAPNDGARLQRILGDHDTVDLGEFDQRFATEWKVLRGDLTTEIKASGWWKQDRSIADDGSATGSAPSAALTARALAAVLGIGAIILLITGLLTNPVIALIAALAATVAVALAVYSIMLPSRTSTGSALAIRTESFRRFLVASEGRHVDWAWSHGLLREYSAWAAALGAAAAWNRALQASSRVPREEISALSQPLLINAMFWHAAITPPPPPAGSVGGGGGFGGGGFGGFSGGSVGGGGGGGSSGSW